MIISRQPRPQLSLKRWTKTKTTESRQRKEKEKLHASAMFKPSINKARLDSLTALDFYCW